MHLLLHYIISPVTINTHTQRTYSLFRNLGLRFLPVVNKYNQVVGTITRSDLTADALAETMLQKGKKHEVRSYFTVLKNVTCCSD